FQTDPSWVAIFLCDSAMFRKNGYDLALLVPDSKKHYNWGGIISWVIATITGFLFTNNAVWNGPFAHGIFRNNSLGVFISAIVAIICMFIVKMVANSNGEGVMHHE
ncbi:allantoin permease, partial [Levilactobacillus brevis]|nr:allantoin permease [Levilactobacillus brevis]